MEDLALLAPIVFLLVALLAGAILKLLLSRINVPYTVGLFVVGLIIGTMRHFGALHDFPLLEGSVTMACNIDPDLILNIFLPILIFSAAYELDIHIFRKTLTNSTMLAVPGLIIAMVITAALMMLISIVAPEYSGWNWSFALMFGALISATDPVAVVALLGELSISKRFSTLIDGESMLNDGSGIVLFMMVYAPFTAVVASNDQTPVLEFLSVVVGGIIIGFLSARLFVYFATRKSVRGDMMLQTSAMILLSYLSFVFAQDLFELSGVIALVTFGLGVAYYGVDKIDERAQKFMKELWGLLAYIANTLIFIIIGVIIADKVHFTWGDVAVLFVVYIGINVARSLMIVMLYPLLKRSGYGLSKREAVILSWGALRGAVGLTLALMVSYTESIPEEVRRQVLLLTAGIVTLTLVINATTMKLLLSKLGMLSSTAARELQRLNVRNTIHQRSTNYLEDLKSDQMMGSTDWSKVEQMLPISLNPAEDQPTKLDLLAGIRLQLLSYQRAAIWSLYNNGEIAITAQRKLIDILDRMVDSDGHTSLDEFKFRKENRLLRSSVVRNNRWLRNVVCYIYMISPADYYEFAYGTLVSNRKLKERLKEMLSSSSLNEEQRADLKLLDKELDSVITKSSSYISHFAHTMPEVYSETLTRRATRMIARHERETIHNLVAEGMIDEEAANELLDEFAREKSLMV